MDEANRFLDNMVSYGLGHLVDKLADEQERIVEAVRETGKGGSLTLKLTYKMNGRHQIDVIPTVTPKIPVKAIKTVTMFAGEDNMLHEEDPDQLNFDNVTKLDDHKKEAVNQV